MTSEPVMGQPLLDEQIAYYRARAVEYDEWFNREGRYDRGPELNARWHAQVARVRAELDRFAPRADVLELACGTGLWTRQLVRHADSVTAVDVAPEMLAINRRRVPGDRVRHVQADLFLWRPDRKYDVVFFAFWLSHVPLDRFDDFWRVVAGALRAGGRVFFVDSLYEPTSTATNHQLEGPLATIAARRLNDGREFRVIKVFHHPRALADRLGEAGWCFHVDQTEDYFLFGHGARRTSGRAPGAG